MECTDKMSIIERIEAAKEQFSGWDWTMEFGCDKDGNPDYFDCRPDVDDQSDGAAEAREYDDSVDAAVEACRDLADSAIAAIERGDMDAAVANMNAATRLEGEFGDSPAYGGIAGDISECIEDEK